MPPPAFAKKASKGVTSKQERKRTRPDPPATASPRPGRIFDSLEDLNKQGRQWATERMEYRPQGSARLIPAKAFEHECSYLHQLPLYLPAPYQVHRRGTDQYGYVALGANDYWVPGSRRDDVKVLQYADHMKIYLRHCCLAEYPLPPDGVRGQHFSPPGQPQPQYQPKNRQRHAPNRNV